MAAVRFDFHTMIQIDLPDIDIHGFEPLTHYLPERHFRSLLTARALYATRVDAQKGDPNDGRLPAKNLVAPSPQDTAIVRTVSPTTPDAFVVSQAI
eukprot:gene16500-22381_t